MKRIYRVSNEEIKKLLKEHVQKETGIKNLTQIKMIRIDADSAGVNATVTYDDGKIEGEVEKKKAIVTVNEPNFGVSDTVRLRALTSEARSIIKRYGQWWRVGPMSTTTDYILTNLNPKEQGRFRGSVTGKGCIYQMKMRKDSQREDFRVVDVCYFPDVFDHKNCKYK